jgi:hypothetical protein
MYRVRLFFVNFCCTYLQFVLAASSAHHFHRFPSAQSGLVRPMDLSKLELDGLQKRHP